MRKSLLALLLVAVGGLAQAAVQLKDNHPERYTCLLYTSPSPRDS